MKAYELTATVTDNGQIQLPDFRLSPTFSQPSTVKVIILVDEIEENKNELDSCDENFSEESFKKSWQQAITGDTVPFNPLTNMKPYAYLADPSEPAISPDDWEMNEEFEEND